MDISNDETTKKIHAKLSDGVNSLMKTRSHLESFQKDLEATVMVQLKYAKASLKEKKQGLMDTIARRERLIEDKKGDTVEAVAEWKARHHQQKLDKRAERAEEYADACVTLAMYYAAEAELTILEAIAARQDAVTEKYR